MTGRQELLSAALDYAAQDIPVFPCTLKKKPVTANGFYDATTDENQIREWWKRKAYSIAIPTGQASLRIVLDPDEPNGEASLRELEAQRGPLPETLQVHTKHGRHLYFRWPGVYVRCSNDGRFGANIDMRGDGGYAIVPPSLFSTNDGCYAFINSLPLALPPGWLIELANAKPSTKPKESKPKTRVDANLLVKRALELIHREYRNGAGFWLAQQLRDNRYAYDEAWEAMRLYASRVGPTNAKGVIEAYTEQEAEASLLQAYSRPAREPWGAAAKPRIKGHSSADASTNAAAGQFPDLVTGYEPQDAGNAERLIKCYGEELVYCHAFKKWLVWDSRRWALDEGERTLELTWEVMRQFGLQAVNANNEALIKFAAGCRNAARLVNAMRLAQPKRRITPDELDTYPYLLNCSNGVVDLRTGELHAHHRELFLTKLVHYDYHPQAECPLFTRFLSEITANHPELVNYLQKALGYSLTADTSEKVIFLPHGPGDNGKTTLLSTFWRIVREYAAIVQAESLMLANRESTTAQADLADLFGARFVMTSETEEGQRLSEGRIKRITQGMGGRIKVCRKYENPFSFQETHKLWFDANHLPVIRGTDNAIWNRLHAIPFDVVITKPDQELPANLQGEAEGILAWAVGGCVRWYRERLGRPPGVQRVGADWRKQSDQIGRFREDRCVVGPQLEVPARRLYLAYKTWAEEVSEAVESETIFGKRLVALGFERIEGAHGRTYKGIGLKV